MHHAIRVEPDDTAGVERLCRYLVHPPIALGRLTYDGVRAGYRGRRVHPVSGAQSVTLDPLEMLARLCQHIPPPGFHLTRLYGIYANRTRGARARLGAAAGERPSPGDSEPDTPTPSQRERRREWARLIARVFEVDPLRCRCGGTMRVVAFILDPTGLRRGPTRRRVAERRLLHRHRQLSVGPRGLGSVQRQGVRAATARKGTSADRDDRARAAIFGATMPFRAGRATGGTPFTPVLG